MSQSGCIGLADGALVADACFTGQIAEPVGALASFIRRYRGQRFTIAFPSDEVQPTAGILPPALSGGVKWQPLRLASLEWRCIPLLWPITPGTAQIVIRIGGEIILEDMYFALSLDTTAMGPVTTATVGDTYVEVSCDVPADRGGRSCIIYIWFRSIIDTVGGDLYNGSCETRAPSAGTIWWYPPPPGPESSDVARAYISNTNGMMVLAATGMADAIEPLVIEVRSGAAVVAEARQIVRAENATYRVWFTPPIIVVGLGVGETLATDTVYDWAAIGLSYVDVSYIHIREVGAQDDGVGATLLESGDPLRGRSYGDALRAITDLVWRGRIFEIAPSPPDYAQLGVMIDGTSWQTVAIVRLDEDIDLATYEIALLLQSCSPAQNVNRFHLRLTTWENDGITLTDTSTLSDIDLPWTRDPEPQDVWQTPGVCTVRGRPTASMAKNMQVFRVPREQSPATAATWPQYLQVEMAGAFNGYTRIYVHGCLITGWQN